MIELVLKNKKGDLKIDSNDIKEVLEYKDDFEFVTDISDTINQKNIMVYDCKLDPDIFDIQTMEEVINDLKVSISDFDISIKFEDIKAYIKDLCDEVESDIKEIYNIEEVRCYFDIYGINESINDFRFVFLISFDEIKISSLMSLAQLIGKRQLQGKSKYYN